MSGFLDVLVYIQSAFFVGRSRSAPCPLTLARNSIFSHLNWVDTCVTMTSHIAMSSSRVWVDTLTCETEQITSSLTTCVNFWVHILPQSLSCAKPTTKPDWEQPVPNVMARGFWLISRPQWWSFRLRKWLSCWNPRNVIDSWKQNRILWFFFIFFFLKEKKLSDNYYW